MEGYLSLLHKKKFTKFWFVLEGQQLTYYERLDLIQQLPVRVQGTIHLKDATIKAVIHDARRYVICITTSSATPGGVLSLQQPQQVQEFLDCEQGEHQSVWFQCLVRASQIHNSDDAGHNRAEAIQRYASMLGIEPGTPISLSSVAKTYRRLCLKAHPDKGGDITKFNEINIAYNKLLALQAEVEARQVCEEVEYEALVEKGADKVGLGLVVSEDQVRMRIMVTQVNENILLRGLSEAAGGAIEPGDCLVAIDKDDCTAWPMSRIKARLNNFRVPVGMVTRMRFSRRLQDSREREDQDQLNSPLASPPTTPSQHTVPPTPERQDRREGEDAKDNKSREAEPAVQPAVLPPPLPVPVPRDAAGPSQAGSDERAARMQMPQKEYSTQKISVYLEDYDESYPQTAGFSIGNTASSAPQASGENRTVAPSEHADNAAVAPASSDSQNEDVVHKLDISREIVVELQMTKLRLFEAEAAATSWKERSEALEEEMGVYKRRLFQSEERAAKHRQLVEAQAREAQTLKQNLEKMMNLIKEASIHPSPSGSSGQLELHLERVQRSTVDDFMAISDFDRKIRAQLDELRGYCGAGAGQSDEGAMDARAIRGRRYRDTEERARTLEKHILSLV